jgi:hypothetical protein
MILLVWLSADLPQYERYYIESQLNIIISDFLINNNMTDPQTYEMKETLATYNLWS